MILREIIPNDKQIKQINNTIEVCRLVYNEMLTRRRETHLNLKDTMHLLTELKSQPQYSRWNEVDSRALQAAVRELDRHYQLFFQHVSTYPQYLREKYQYVTYNNGKNIYIKGDTIHLPKIGFVKIELHRDEAIDDITMVVVNRHKVGGLYSVYINQRKN